MDASGHGGCPETNLGFSLRVLIERNNLVEAS